ncbi:MAG: FAD binding domain-containing protein [Alphaproteobacteria bacterium]|jgi:carbon-monoxide dehydrogenase medium subunit|tara:strand:+ start:384 stop:1172 length:789 start_codon:yes stop_codon:yes gene_type:complete
MYQFNYHSPKNIEEALNIYNTCEEPKFLAGGMTLIASMKQRLIAPSDLIDLRTISNLSEISLNNNIIRIGSLCSHDKISNNDIIKSNIVNMSKLASGIGDPAVRNMGTIGGSIANSDPAADWPAAVLALNSNIVTNNREINNKEVFTNMFETCLEENEIITEINFEIPEFFNYIKFPNPASRYAIVGVAIAKYENKVSVAISGASHTPFIAKELSEALTMNFSDNIPLNTISSDELNEDIHASSEYRANLIDVLTKKVLKTY